MSYQHLKNWRTKVLFELKKAFQSRCGMCGYDKCTQALEFHHLDPSAKDFAISSGTKNNWSLLVSEAQKCVLLCSNCHREVHNGVAEVTEATLRFDSSKLEFSLEKLKTHLPCPVCGKEKTKHRQFCSKDCSFKQREKGSRWEQFDLERHLNEGLSYEKIGKIAGVTGAAVKKRALKLGLVKK